MRGEVSMRLLGFSRKLRVVSPVRGDLVGVRRSIRRLVAVRYVEMHVLALLAVFGFQSTEAG